MAKKLQDKLKTQVSRSPVYGVPGIPEALCDVIEEERENLGNALSVLQCMNLAMEQQGVPSEGPYWPAIAQIAIKMLRGSFNALDSNTIEKRLAAKPRRRRVNEEELN